MFIFLRFFLSHIIYSSYLCPCDKMDAKVYKYQNEIDELISLGCQLPELFPPNDISAFRFAYSDFKKQSHVPQYMSNPRRMLQDISKNRMTISLLALSCFDTAAHAETFYVNLKKAFRNISSTIGDSLSEGVLTNNDGMKTINNSNGHFDFYEYEGCDLNNTFQIIKDLNADEKDKRI